MSKSTAPIFAQLLAAEAARAITPTSQLVGSPEKFKPDSPKVLDIIRTAAADCSDSMARNELLDAAGMVRALLTATEAAIAYDTAIQSCGNSPALMASFCTATGENLDVLYARWISLSREALAKATGSAS